MSKYYKVNKCSMCYAFKSSSVPHYASDDCTKIAVYLTPSELKTLTEVLTDTKKPINFKLKAALDKFLEVMSRYR